MPLASDSISHSAATSHYGPHCSLPQKGFSLADKLTLQKQTSARACLALPRRHSRPCGTLVFAAGGSFWFSGEIVISYLSCKDRDLIISSGSCSLQCVQINVNLASFSYSVCPETRNRIEMLSGFAARSPEGLLQRGLPVGCWKRGSYGSLYSPGFLSMGSPPAAFSLWFKTPALAD